MQYIITQIHELKRNVMIIAASEEPFSRILFYKYRLSYNSHLFNNILHNDSDISHNNKGSEVKPKNTGRSKELLWEIPQELFACHKAIISQELSANCDGISSVIKLANCYCKTRFNSLSAV